ncbi:hypothetical protein, partial [Thiolapillus sp.]
RDTIRWSPFKWPFRDSSMLIGVSSYDGHLIAIDLTADLGTFVQNWLEFYLTKDLTPYSPLYSFGAMRFAY